MKEAREKHEEWIKEAREEFEERTREASEETQAKEGIFKARRARSS